MMSKSKQTLEMKKANHSLRITAEDYSSVLQKLGKDIERITSEGDCAILLVKSRMIANQPAIITSLHCNLGGGKNMDACVIRALGNEDLWDDWIRTEDGGEFVQNHTPDK